MPNQSLLRKDSVYYKISVHKDLLEKIFDLLDKECLKNLNDEEKKRFKALKKKEKYGFIRGETCPYKGSAFSMNYFIFQKIMHEQKDVFDAKTHFFIEEKVKFFFSENYFLPKGYNLRYFNDVSKELEKFKKTKIEVTFLTIDIRFLEIIFDYLEISWNYFKEGYNSLYIEQRRKEPPIRLKDYDEVMKERKEQEHTYYFRFHNLPLRKNKDFDKVWEQQYNTGLATFIDRPNLRGVSQPIEAFLEKDGDKIYEGNLYHHNEHFRSASYLSVKEGKDKKRPLSVFFTNQAPLQADSFQDIRFFIGEYMVINRRGEPEKAKIIFERIEMKESLSKIDVDKVKYYLKNAEEFNIEKISTVEAFHAQIEEQVSDFDARKSIFNQIAGKTFELWLVINKDFRQGRRLDKYLEKTLFHFTETGQVICKSVSSSSKGIHDLYGNIKLLNKRLEIFLTRDRVRYHFIINVPISIEEEINELSGVYCGVTQTNVITAGRAKLIATSITRKEFIEALKYKPEIYDIKAGEHLKIFKNPKYQDLKAFLAGVDNDWILNPELFYPGRKHIEKSTEDFSDFQGTYYFYRTRTLTTKNYDAKFFPLFLREDGAVFMKFDIDGEVNEDRPNGFAYFIKGRLYIKFMQPNSQEGLAIFYYSEESDEGGIYGFYLTTEKHLYLITGQAYLYKISDSRTKFNNSNVGYISEKGTDSHFFLGKDEAEKKIIQSLKGMGNNYYIRRNSQSLPNEDFGKIFFKAAFFSVAQGEIKEGFKLLEKALLEENFDKFELIQKELNPVNKNIAKLREFIKKEINEPPNENNTNERNAYLRYRKILFEQLLNIDSN